MALCCGTQWPLINTLGWAVGYNFAVTLAAFPGLTVDVYPYGEYFSGNISLWVRLSSPSLPLSLSRCPRALASGCQPYCQP